MSKELQGLTIGNSPEDGPELDLWFPRFNHKETQRPITKFVIGLVPSGNRYYPVEMDLTKREPNNIFVVGGADPYKEYFMLSLIKRASEVISPGYLNINLIADVNDPHHLAGVSPLVVHRIAKPIFTTFPEGPLTAKILDSVTEKLNKNLGIFETKKLYPDILAIENLSNFETKILGNQDKNEKFKKILEYRGPQPHLTVATINEADLPILKENGIGPDITPGIWLFRKGSVLGKAKVKGIGAGFHTWNRKKKKFSEFCIIPFNF